MINCNYIRGYKKEYGAAVIRGRSSANCGNSSSYGKNGYQIYTPGSGWGSIRWK